MESQHWWQDAVVYQVYVRSFADANGDGVGDLEGIRSRMGHLSALGVDALWLNPCYPSPQFDHGYDVADYLAIHDEYGDIAVFDAAARRGPRARHQDPDGPRPEPLLERPRLVRRRARRRARAAPSAPGSTSATGSRPATIRTEHRRTTGRLRSAAPAWTRASADDPQWYLGTFTSHQPDFDHTNADVQAMFAEVLEFWFDRGVEGFRVDAITPVGKHPELPDAPPVPEGTGMLQVTWENPFTVFRPEGHDVWRHFRNTIDDYMDRHPGRDLMMVAEAYMNGRPDLMAAFVNDEQFHQAFAFDLLLSPWVKPEMERAIRDTLDIIRIGSSPTWTLNNHDVQRSSPGSVATTQPTRAP